MESFLVFGHTDLLCLYSDGALTSLPCNNRFQGLNKKMRKGFDKKNKNFHSICANVSF